MVHDARISPFEGGLVLSFCCLLVLLKTWDNLVNKEIPGPLAFFTIAELNGVVNRAGEE